MNTGYRFVTFLFIFAVAIVLASPARAQVYDTQNQIKALLEQITLLQEQLRLLTGTANTSTQSVDTESWEKRFVTSTTPIPTNALRAFYFDIKAPKQVIFQEVVGGVDTHYLPDNNELGGISSEGFGGYWIGNYVFTKAQKYTIHVAQGGSESRIRINGKVVFE